MAITRTKWAIWVNHTDGSRTLFYAPTFVLAKREGSRYLAHPNATSVDIGPWDGPASAVTYHRAKGETDWQNMGHQGRLAAKVRVKVSL